MWHLHLLKFGCSNLKNVFHFFWWFSVLKNPQGELHPKENSVLDTWHRGQQQKIWYKVGSYDLTTRVKEPKGIRYNPIYKWYMAHLVWAVIFQLSGSIHPYFLMASIWSTGHWTAVIFSIHGNGWEWYIYLFFRKSYPSSSMQVHIYIYIYNTWMVWGTWYTATIHVSTVYSMYHVP